MNPRTRIAAAGLVVLAACGPVGEAGNAVDSPDESMISQPSPPPNTVPTVEVPPGLTSVVEAARADLASRLGIAAVEIVLVTAEEVTWRDGSLGCPQPGMLYTQALVTGSRFVFDASGALYAYHAGENEPPFFCETPDKPLPP